MARAGAGKDQRRLIAKAEAAGWQVRDTKAGWKLYSPDGKTIVTMHTSSSDNRAIANMRSDLRKGGLDV